jgi:hypothetical protein
MLKYIYDFEGRLYVMWKWKIKRMPSAEIEAIYKLSEQSDEQNHVVGEQLGNHSVTIQNGSGHTRQARPHQ